MNGYEDTECEKYFTPPDKPSNRKAVIELLKKVLEDYAGDPNPECAYEYYIPSVADQICSLFPKVLSEVEEAVAAKSIIYAQAGDRAIKEIAEKLLLMLFHDHDMKGAKEYLERLSQATVKE